mgnify:CR=1 FL=1
MSMMNKLKDMLGMNEEDYEEDVQDISVEEIVNNSAGQRKANPAAQPASSQGRLQFVLVKPERFDDSIQIANHLLECKTVVLNLEAVGKELARRIIDFLSGSAYAVGAKIKKVAIGTYIIAPNNSDISGDELEEQENSGAFY